MPETTQTENNQMSLTEMECETIGFALRVALKKLTAEVKELHASGTECAEQLEAMEAMQKRLYALAVEKFAIQPNPKEQNPMPETTNQTPNPISQLAAEAVAFWQMNGDDLTEMNTNKERLLLSLRQQIEALIEALPIDPATLSDARLYALAASYLQDAKIPADNIQEVASYLYYWNCDPNGDYKWNNECDREALIGIIAKAQEAGA